MGKTKPNTFCHGVFNGVRLFPLKTSILSSLLFLIAMPLLSVLLSAFVSTFLFPSSAFAEAKESSITMTTTSNNHVISILPHTFSKSSSSTISVKTDNYSGYTLSISMPSVSGVSSGSLSDGSGHEISSLSSSVSESSFSSSESYNNKWGYRPSQYISGSGGSGSVVANTNFLPAPTSTGTTLDVTSSANATTAKTYTLDFGARVDNNTPAGNYTGRLVVYAVVNDVTYNITYDKNTTDTVSSMPSPNPQIVTIAGGTPTAGSVATLSNASPTRTGYNFAGWCSVATTNDATTSSQTCSGTTYAAGGSYGIDQTADGSNIRLYAIWTSKTYTINLNGNGATTAGSSTTTATYGSPTLSAITNPARVYNIGGYTLPSSNHADGASVTYGSTGNCTSSSNCKSTYTFNGWYKESGATNKIASNSTTPALQASTTYTDGSSRWTYTDTSSSITLYAGWSSQAVTLPSITKTGYTCGWTETSSGATTITYNSGASLTPTKAYTLYGVCKANTYTITLNGNGATNTYTTSTTATYDATTLASIATLPTKSSTTGTRTISGFTLPSGNNADSASITWPSSGCTSSSNCKSTNTTTYTFNGWHQTSGTGTLVANTASTPVLQANTAYTNASGKWNSTSGQTLYAGWTESAGSYSGVTLPQISKTGYTCGWTTTSTGATSITYASGGSLTPTGNVTLYGVCTANSYTITLNANGGSGGSSSTSVTYGGTTLGTITNPTKASTTGTRTISGLTADGTNASGATVTFQSSGNCTSTSNCKSTNTTTYTFNGWHQTSGTGTLVASSATTPVLQASTAYTDANGKWNSTSAQTLYAGWTESTGSYAQLTLPTITKTGYNCSWNTNTSGTGTSYNSGASITPSSNLTLHGVCAAKTYTVSLNANGGSGGSASATATYNATTLSTITNPTKSNTTGTRTISGFTLPSGNNADSASITWPSSGCTSSSNCKSTNTTTYAFNGWYKETGATNKIASNATTPVLQASTAYTDASGKWTNDGAVTLYAGWTASAGAYSSVTLPSISKTGYTCGWTTTSTGATSITYASGGSLTPTGNVTLYGVCTANSYTITLNANGGSGGSSSTSVTYGGTTLGAITRPTKSSTTGTRSISGFTLPSGNNADSASVTWPSSGCTSSSNCNSTNTTTYTFNGWHQTSGTGTLVASNAATPVLQANSAYTDGNGKWNSTSGQTLYAGWTESAGSYSSVTLPQITKTGYTCGWTTTSTGATSIAYSSGGSLVPSGNTTLYGVCTAKTYNLVITGDANVSTMTVKQGSTSGTATTCTKSGTTFTCSSLTYGTNYYLFPTFASGYEFNSWAKTDSATNSALSSTTTENAYYTMGAGAGALTLTSKASCVGVANMQDLNPNTIATLLPNAGDTVQLYDSRDNTCYNVGKLADGNYWMLDNLALDPTAVSLADLQGKTNASDTTLGYLKNGGGTTSDQYATAGVANWTSSYSYSAPLVNMASKDTIPSDAISTAGGYKVGGYYNFCAATAGSYCYGNGTSYGTSSGNATEDICPKGWRMPTGNTSGEYRALYNNASYNTYANYRSALRLPLSGVFYNGSASGQGSNGYFWSSTRYDISNMFSLTLGTSGVYPSDYVGRVSGFSVRCVLDLTPTMQDQTPSSMAELLPNAGDTVTLKDNRDGTKYTVGKLADGNYWMLDNLALDPTAVSLADLQGKTNASDTTLNYLKNGGGTTSDKYPTAKLNNEAWTSSSQNYYSIPMVNTGSINTVPSDATSTAGGWKVGVYYNFCAASAGSYCYGDGTSTGTSSRNATEDICPAGWRMPTGNTSGEYSALANAIYGSTGTTSDATAVANYRAALHLPLSGRFDSGSATSQGSYGNFWSSTRYDNNGIYVLSLNASSVFPANNVSRNRGYSVRCILKPTMQSATSESLATMLPNNGDITMLKDERDGKYYTVGKLADENYWMLDNLDLAGGTALSADDTDVTSAYISSFSTSNNLTKSGSTIVLPASSTSGFNTNNYSYVYNSGNKTNCGASGQNTPCYSYYSWDAATLGSGRSISTVNTDAQQSICPKGWKLPTSRTTSATNWQTTSDFYVLAHQYGLDSTTSTSEYDNGFYTQAGPGTIPNFLLAGYYGGGSFYDGGSGGYYWSSTSYSSTYYASSLYFGSNSVDSADFGYRSGGFSVRCLLNIPVMQDQTPSSMAELLPNTGHTVTLKDKRDGKKYTVGKLADGNYWMLDNLALDPTTVSLVTLQGNTNASDTTLGYLKNGGGTTSDKYAITGLGNLTSGHSYSEPRINTNYINTIATDSTSTSGGYKIGVFYNYCAASAGSYCYGNGTSEGTSSGNATEDLCPAGWRMPTGGDSGEYQTLYSNSNYKTYAKYRAALHLPLSGDFYNGSLSNVGSGGRFWSSTRDSSSSMYYLYLSTSFVSPDGSYSRYIGQSMRCVLASSSGANSTNNQSTTSTEPDPEPASDQAEPIPTEVSYSTTPPTISTTDQDDDDEKEEEDDEYDSGGTVISPRGVVAEQGVQEYDPSELYGPNQGTDYTPVLVATAGAASIATLIFLFTNRKKRDDEDDIQTPNTPTFS